MKIIVKHRDTFIKIDEVKLEKATIPYNLKEIKEVLDKISEVINKLYTTE